MAGAVRGPMRGLRASWRLARMLAHLLHGMAVMGLRFPGLDATGRQARIQWWSAKLVRLVGLNLHVSGTPRPGATLLLANHVSWLDIAAIHALAPQARFVSKADVLAWPLLGRLIQGAGTLFIERERKRDALRVLHQVADSLKAGDSVAVFPEGTTGDGATLLPFHANLLQAAIATGTPVQGVALRYSDPGHRFSPAVHFLGADTLLHSVWRVVSAQGLGVHVDLLPAQEIRSTERRTLAEAVRAQIHERLHPAVPSQAPAEARSAVPPAYRQPSASAALPPR